MKVRMMLTSIFCSDNKICIKSIFHESDLTLFELERAPMLSFVIGCQHIGELIRLVEVGLL